MLDDRMGGVERAGATETGGEAAQRGGRRLVCSRCGYPITSEADRVNVAGAHLHTFANPHGFIYRIGCFGTAPGCAGTGQQSADFTWFAGYTWETLVCARCATHLGWRFTSSDRTFAGLIIDKLVEGDGPDGA